MRAIIMYGAGEVRIENVPDAKIGEPTDAVVRVTRAGAVGRVGVPQHELMPASQPAFFN